MVGSEDYFTTGMVMSVIWLLKLSCEILYLFIPTTFDVFGEMLEYVGEIGVFEDTDPDPKAYNSWF